MTARREPSTLALALVSGLLLALTAGTAGTGCTTRNPYNPGHGDGGDLPDAGSQLDSGGQQDAGAGLDQGGAHDGAPQPDSGLAPDTKPAGCTSNKQCGASNYCKFAAGSCGKAPGGCAVRPKACPEYYSPTCGCDDKTYGNPCNAASAGVSVKHAGACQQKKTCNQLNADYVAAVKDAKKCAPMLPVVQCQVKVDNALHCACTTYVEQANAQVLAKLTQIKAQFKAQGCVPYQCGMPCPVAKPGQCMPAPGGVTGACQ